DDGAGCGVDLAGAGAGGDGVPPGTLGLGDEVVDLALPPGGRAEADGAGHVGVVALVGGAEVDGDQVAGAQLPVGGGVVRDGAVLAGGDDGVEGRLARAQLDHAGFEEAGHVAFGDAGPDGVQDVGEGLVGDGAGGTEELQLVVVLDGPQPFDQGPERDEPGPEPLVGGHAHVGRLDADAGGGGLAGHVGGLGRLDVEAVRLLDVPVVGHGQRRAVGPDQDGRVGAGEPGEVADVHGRGDQHGVDLVGGQQGGELRPPLCVIEGHAFNVR